MILYSLYIKKSYRFDLCLFIEKFIESQKIKTLKLSGTFEGKNKVEKKEVFIATIINTANAYDIFRSNWVTFSTI